MSRFKGRADRGRVIELLSNLVAIDSVNPSGEGGSQGEAQLAEYLADFFRDLRMEVSTQEALPGRPNVLARWKGSRSDRTLLFQSHLDTVTASNMPDGLRPRLEGSKLHGRGACDIKGATAAFLHTLELLAPQREELPADLLYLGAVDEEIAYTGSRFFVQNGGRADAAVVFEPTGLQPVIAHKGALRVRIATHGRSAHTARPELGDNAIYQMAEVVRALRKRIEATLPERQHPLCGSATLAVSRISGGLQINIVPPACYADIDWRTLPDEDPTGEVLDRLRGFLDQLNREQPWIHAEVDRIISSYRGLDTPVDAPIVGAALGACQTILGSSQPAGAPYGTDASELAQAMPCVVLGPGDIAQAHTSDEWVDVEQVAQAAEIYAELAMRF